MVCGEWPYREFEGLGKGTFSNGNEFMIKENEQVVSIQVLPYPDWATRALEDIFVDVPFTVMGMTEE